MDNPMKKAAEVVRGAQNLIALTGAGISVESGIPDFRSSQGLWARYDPAIYATIDAFRAMPERVWDMIFEMIDITQNARPNPGHRALAELEAMDILKSIITQNIDNLHQEAGNKNVIEYHGNASKLECLSCGKRYDHNLFDLTAMVPPRCTKCDIILKPAVVFFGEMIPHDAMLKSQALAESADAILVIGTSAVVYPAAGLPLVAKQNNATVIEFNTEPTDLSVYATDIYVEGLSGETLPELVKLVKKKS